MRIAKLAVVGCLVALFSACNAQPPKSDVEVVKERAQARMDALLANDAKAAYALMTPGYRGATKLTEFETTAGLAAARMASAEARNATCEELVCKVFVYAQYRFPGKLVVKGQEEATFERVNEEKWIKVDGEWWFMSLQ